MDIGFLNRFEEKIQNELLRICTQRGMLSGTLLATDDVTEHWDVLAPDYVADAYDLVKARVRDNPQDGSFQEHAYIDIYYHQAPEPKVEEGAAE